jgi:hypothetical protein
MPDSKPSPRALIIVDISGALVTCVIAGALFATDVLPTGMPVLVLLALSAAAAGLCAVGSFRLATASDPSSTLRTFAGLNTSYYAAAGPPLLPGRDRHRPRARPHRGRDSATHPLVDTDERVTAGAGDVPLTRAA